MVKQSANDKAADPVSDRNPYPRYEPGTRDVRCFRAVLYRSKRFKRWVCRLDCQFLWNSGEICGFLNLGNGDRPHAGGGSLYRRVWVMANGAQPRKRQPLARSVFVDRVSRVRIADVDRRHDNTEASEPEKYSTIQEFLACVGP